MTIAVYSNVYHPVANVWAHNGSAWKQANNVWVHNGSAWKLAYTQFNLNTSSITLSNLGVTPGIRTASLTLTKDGAMSGSNLTGSANWGVPNSTDVGAGYWIKCTDDGGSMPLSALAYNTWYQLNVNRTFSWQTASPTALGAAGVTFSLSADGGATTLATFNGQVDVGYDP